MDTILDGAQTRFFARALANPTAVGDLWPASLKADNEAADMDSDLTKEEGVTVVLGGVAGGVAHGAKVGARIMYIDAFSPHSPLPSLRNVLYT